MNTKNLILSILLVMVIIGCATQPQLTPEQKRAITTRTIDANYDNTFRAVLAVLQDRQFIIDNTDKESGLINASIDITASGTSQALQAAFAGRVGNKGQKEKVSVMVDEISANQTEVRLNIQVAVYGQSSKYGSQNEQQSTQQVLQPDVYNRLFEEIKAEAKRRG